MNHLPRCFQASSAAIIACASSGVIKNAEDHQTSCRRAWNNGLGIELVATAIPFPIKPRLQYLIMEDIRPVWLWLHIRAAMALAFAARYGALRALLAQQYPFEA